MSRKMLLFLLLLILIVTTQFRWWQQLVGRREFLEQHEISELEDSEKSINKLNELVQDLKEQLQQCWSSENEEPDYSVRKNSTKFAPT